MWMWIRGANMRWSVDITRLALILSCSFDSGEVECMNIYEKGREDKRRKRVGLIGVSWFGSIYCIEMY